MGQRSRFARFEKAYRRGEHGSPETTQSSLHRIFHCNSRKNQVQSFLYKKLKFIVAKIYRS